MGRRAVLSTRPRLGLLALALVLASASPGLAHAEEPVQPTGTEALRVFLDCARRCDFDFLRREIPYVNYVRDRRDADVHVLVTTERSGAGIAFKLRAIGLGDRFDGIEHEVTFSTSQTDTSDERRRELARMLQLTLVRYLLETPQAAGLSLSYQPPDGDSRQAATAADDPWNFWVYRMGANASLSGEDRQDSKFFSGFATASRTTDRWRLGLGLNGNFFESTFELSSDETFTNTRRDYGVGGQLVRSLGRHWGVGVGLSGRRSTFLNLDPSYRVAGALEYNVFPYSESSERLLTVSYFVGAARLAFEEETIFGRLEDTLADQGIIASYDVRRPWGQSGVDLEMAHFVDDPSLYRLRLDGEITYRIVRGLELSFSGNASLVRDQIYLPAREATDEEVLVARRALATDSRFRIGIGLRYTFGSIYNNIVNSRLRGSSGGFHRIF